MTSDFEPAVCRTAARVAIAALALTTACGGGDNGLRLPADPITALIGELHLHQFPLGSHAWAAFVDAPVPASQVHSDQLYQLDTIPTASEGTCTLWRRPVCQPDCAASSYCAGTNTCRPIPLVRYVDGGPICITGSQLHPTIRLDFTTADTVYASDPPPGKALLFAGGELLHVGGGAGATQLGGALPAPAIVTVRMPDLTAPFHLPTSGPLEIRWDSGGAAEVVLLLSASTDSGDYASIRCVGPDAGQATVPASLLAGLPPPPRSNRLEVERDNELLLRTVTPGVGLLAHAAFSAWVNGDD